MGSGNYADFFEDIELEVAYEEAEEENLLLRKRQSDE